MEQTDQRVEARDSSSQGRVCVKGCYEGIRDVKRIAAIYTTFCHAPENVASLHPKVDSSLYLRWRAELGSSSVPASR
jgi:hypothetical protein